MLEKDIEYDKKISKFPLPFNIEYTPYETDYNEKVLQFCKENGIINSQKLSKVIIIGDIGVGKTSIVNRFCYKNFDINYKATIGVDFEVVNFNVLNIPFGVQIWDTAGQERFRSLARSYYRAANVIVAVFDLGKINSLANCKQWYDDALKENEKNRPTPYVFLVGNKLDSISLAAYDSVNYFIVKMLKVIKAEYWPVSSKTGINISELFNRVAALAFQSTVLQELTDSQITKTEIGKFDVTVREVRRGKLKAKCHSCSFT